jgi:hypothetical protein
MNMKIANSLFALLMILGLVLGCRNTNRNDQPKSSSKNTTDSEPSDLSIEVRQLAYEFKENEIRANQLYKGKRMTVTGTVGGIENYGGTTVLVFERGLLNPDTICYFTDVNHLAQLRHNRGVTVEATVLGFDGDKITVLLDDCSLR